MILFKENCHSTSDSHFWLAAQRVRTTSSEMNIQFKFDDNFEWYVI